MSVRRMSVKLIPRLASTGPRLNTANSSTKGSASAHAATACCRRVGSTCLLVRALVPVPVETVLMSQTGADLLGLALHLGNGVLDRGVALRGLLDLTVDHGGDLLPRRHGRRSEGVVELLTEDGQLRVLGELAAVPGLRHGGQVAHLVVEALLGAGVGEPLDELPGA